MRLLAFDRIVYGRVLWRDTDVYCDGPHVYHACDDAKELGERLVQKEASRRRTD